MQTPGVELSEKLKSQVCSILEIGIPRVKSEKKERAANGNFWS